MSGHDDVTRRLADALQAEASTVTVSGDGLTRIRARVGGRPGRRWAWRLAVAGAAAAAVVGGVLVGVHLSSDDATLHPLPPVTSSRPTAVTPTATTPAPVLHDPSIVLWPFTSLAEARLWQQQADPAGHQPWRHDPAQVALQFVRVDLGVTDALAAATPRAEAAGVAVALSRNDPNGKPFVVTTVHLAQVGDGDRAPWSVVSATSTTMSVTAPAAGSVAGSTVAVTGTVEGVDESIVTRIVGDGLTCPATHTMAGSAAPWHTTLHVSGTATGRAVALVATTQSAFEGIGRIVVVPMSP